MSPRLAAHRILAGVRRGELADEAAGRILPRVSDADRGLALQLAYGCLRLRARLDAWIGEFADRPVERIDADVLDWLRLGVYELRELRTPDHAAVNEAVRGARRTMNARRAGFVNAVLRAAAANPGSVAFPSLEEDPVGHLATWGSHPEWLVRRWLDRWPVEDVASLVRHDNEPPPVVVRFLDDAPEQSDARLEPLPGWPRSFRLASGKPQEVLRDLRAVIQDPAASAVVDYMGSGLAGPVYDACAAPGTKTMTLAGRTDGEIVAGDVSRWRLRRVVESARRLGLAVRAVVADARRAPLASAGTVLVDASCTGTGVLRRRADARWRLRESDLPALVGRQEEILTALAGIVRPGGLLVYATCSLEPEENESVVNGFLAGNAGFAREPHAAPAVPANCLTAAGDLYIRPWITGTDGAYAARLRRAP